MTRYDKRACHGTRSLGSRRVSDAVMAGLFEFVEIGKETVGEECERVLNRIGGHGKEEEGQTPYPIALPLLAQR